MRVVWDTGHRRYSQGVQNGILYPDNGVGVAWNGLISVIEAGQQTQDPRYFDGLRYLTRTLPGPFAGTISAFTYPDELEPYIGYKDFFTAQPGRLFGCSYRTNEEVHIVYNILLSPSNRDYATISGQIEPVSLEWGFTTLPVKIPGGKPSAHLVILIDEVPESVLESLEAALYGNDENDPYLPSVTDIIAMNEFTATMTITDNGNGTWTADGPDDYVTVLGGGKFTITSPSLLNIDADTYTVSTY